MSFQFDHRQLADEMDIYILDEQIGAGLPVWLPNGVAIRDELERFIKRLESRAGYQRVASPHIGKASLYKRSGHLEHFKDDIFPPMKGDAEQEEFYLRPMNCPHHHKIFSAKPRSFRQLPLRLAEYGQVYRYEKSGALRGLSRVRGLCQNDAHIYIDPDQALSEICSVLQMYEEAYRALGLVGYRYRLSLGESGARWENEESILRQALEKMALPYFEGLGEAAFYGPKIDVQMKFASGSEESVASVQLDSVSAEKFDLSFIASSGKAVRPWVIHRAPLGSHERFVSMLLEYYDGRLPGWLAPVQLLILPASDEDQEFAGEVAKCLVDGEVRVQVDSSLGSLSKRLRIAHKQRPFAFLVVGQKERSSGKAKIQLEDEVLEVDLRNLDHILRGRLARP